MLKAQPVNHWQEYRTQRFAEKWSVEARTKFREPVESLGIRLEMIVLPLSSAYITRAETPNIMLGWLSLHY